MCQSLLARPDHWHCGPRGSLGGRSLGGHGPVGAGHSTALHQTVKIQELTTGRRKWNPGAAGSAVEFLPLLFLTCDSDHHRYPAPGLCSSLPCLLWPHSWLQSDSSSTLTQLRPWWPSDSDIVIPGPESMLHQRSDVQFVITPVDTWVTQDSSRQQVAMVFHLITGAVTAFMLYTAVPGSDLFSWHPTLMTISFCLLMSQAIAIFSPESSLLHSSERKDKVQLHW